MVFPFGIFIFLFNVFNIISNENENWEIWSIKERRPMLNGKLSQASPFVCSGGKCVSFAILLLVMTDWLTQLSEWVSDTGNFPIFL